MSSRGLSHTENWRRTNDNLHDEDLFIRIIMIYGVDASTYQSVKSVIYHTYMYLLHYSVGVSTSSSNTISCLISFHFDHPHHLTKGI